MQFPRKKSPAPSFPFRSVALTTPRTRNPLPLPLSPKDAVPSTFLSLCRPSSRGPPKGPRSHRSLPTFSSSPGRQRQMAAILPPSSSYSSSSALHSRSPRVSRRPPPRAKLKFPFLRRPTASHLLPHLLSPTAALPHSSLLPLPPRNYDSAVLPPTYIYPTLSDAYYCCHSRA